MKSFLSTALLTLSSAAFALSVSTAAQANCRPGQTTRVAEAPNLGIEFCGGAVGTADYNCRKLTRAVQVRFIRSCNNSGDGFLTCLIARPGSVQVEIPGGYVADEQRDGLGNLIGCGIKLLPAQVGELRVKIFGGANGEQRILECE